MGRAPISALPKGFGLPIEVVNSDWTITPIRKAASCLLPEELSVAGRETFLRLTSRPSVSIGLIH
jgi:hypothetical protein